MNVNMEESKLRTSVRPLFYHILGLNNTGLDLLNKVQRRGIIFSALMIYLLTIIEVTPFIWLCLNSSGPTTSNLFIGIIVFLGLFLINHYLIILNIQHHDEAINKNNPLIINWTTILFTLVIVGAFSYAISLAFNSYFFDSQTRTEYEIRNKKSLESQNQDRFNEIKDSISLNLETLYRVAGYISDSEKVRIALYFIADPNDIIKSINRIPPLDTVQHFYTNNYFTRKVINQIIDLTPRGLGLYSDTVFIPGVSTRLEKSSSNLELAIGNYSKLIERLNHEAAVKEPAFIERLEILFLLKASSFVIYISGIFTWFILVILKLIPVFTIRRTVRELAITNLTPPEVLMAPKGTSSPDQLQVKIAALDEKLKLSPDDINLLKQKADILRELNSDSFYELSSRIKDLQDRYSVVENLRFEIKLKRLEITNLAFFGTTVWDFERGSNILLGKNGYGKTHLLTLVIALLQRNDSVAKVFFLEKSSTDGLVKLTVTITNASGTHEDFIEYSKPGFKTSMGIIPILSISELRFIDKSSESIRDKKSDFDFVHKPSDYFLRRIPLGDVLNDRLLALCLDFLERKKISLELATIYESVFARLTGSEFEILKAERATDTEYKLLVKTAGSPQPLPIQKASQGTLSVFSIVSLIYRYLDLTSVNATVAPLKIADHFGIVVIDEIDAHLHPSWQQKLVGILRETFPNVQFIIASHSPLLVAGSKENEVNVLRKGTEGNFALHQVKGHFIGATTEDLYHVIFEVEEKDDAYLKYAGMRPFKEGYQKELESLTTKINSLLTENQKNEFESLKKKEQGFKAKLSFLRKIFSEKDRSENDLKLITRIIEEEELEGLTDDEILNALNKKTGLDNKEKERFNYLLQLKKGKEEDRQRIEELKERLYYIEQFEEVEEKRRKINHLKDKANLNLLTDHDIN
jgi:hypothetical protein